MKIKTKIKSVVSKALLCLSGATFAFASPTETPEGKKIELKPDSGYESSTLYENPLIQICDGTATINKVTQPNCIYVSSEYYDSKLKDARLKGLGQDAPFEALKNICEDDAKYGNKFKQMVTAASSHGPYTCDKLDRNVLKVDLKDRYFLKEDCLYQSSYLLTNRPQLHLGPCMKDFVSVSKSASLEKLDTPVASQNVSPNALGDGLGCSQNNARKLQAEGSPGADPIQSGSGTRICE